MPFIPTFSRTLPSKNQFPEILPLRDRGWVLCAIGVGLLVTQVGCSAAKDAGTRLGSGLSVVPSVGTISISTLQKTQVQDMTVYLKGKIGKQAPLIQGAVYELQDGTGSIWVRVQGPVPHPGHEVTIKGTVRYQAIDQNGQQQDALFIDQVDLLHTQGPTQS
jgi:uncharacterized protein YdeI (BOF family)